MSTLAPALRDLTEKEWASQVVDLARKLGWKRYHTFRSDRSEPGWPDEALVRERLVLLELKSETGRLSEPQRDWLSALTKANVEVYVVRPRHLELLAQVLAVRTSCGEFPVGDRGDEARDAASLLRVVLLEDLRR